MKLNYEIVSVTASAGLYSLEKIEFPRMKERGREGEREKDGLMRMGKWQSAVCSIRGGLTAVRSLVGVGPYMINLA